jgi:hypothetical protein
LDKARVWKPSLDVWEVTSHISLKEVSIGEPKDVNVIILDEIYYCVKEETYLGIYLVESGMEAAVT